MLTALLFAGTFRSLTFAHTVASPTKSPAATTSLSTGKAAVKIETVAGRIVKIDMRARTFSVRRGGRSRETEGAEIIDLKAGENVNMNHIKRGGRYIVTYSGGVALNVQATRSVP
jgi:hypothetical protein